MWKSFGRLALCFMSLTFLANPHSGERTKPNVNRQPAVLPDVSLELTEAEAAQN